jgi:alpha-tubulin suppressor-like RCC1 family protein
MSPRSPRAVITAVAGQDLTITLGGTDLNNDDLSFQIASLPTTGLLYQWTPGGRGPAIATPGTMIQDSGRRVILAQLETVNDSFTFIANDGLQDSTPATIQVDTVPARAYTHRPKPLGGSVVELGGMTLASVPTHAWFEWGAIGGYDHSTPPIALAGTGAVMHVTAVLTNLAGRSNFQCRLVASNAFGLSHGMPVLFTTGRRMYGWGSNSNGQLTIATNLTNVVVAAAGWYNSFAIRADGTAQGWGWNSYGQATPPPGSSNLVDMAAGYFHGLALRSDGTVVAWGNNDWEQTNVPAGLSNVVDVSAGYAHSLALKSDGTVVTWGQFAGAIQTNQPPGLSNVVAIAGSLFCDVAVKADGTVVAWGTDNGGGVTSIPAGLRNVVDVAAGEYHCLALKSDGTVVAWGRNTSGQAAVPAGLSNVVAVSAGGNQSVALRADGAIVTWGSSGSKLGLNNVVAVANGYGHGLALGNSIPQAPRNNVSGFAGQDVIVTLTGTDPDGDSLRYRITTLPASGTLYQWVAGERGSIINTSNTWIDDPGGRVIYAHSLSGSQQFSYVANDGSADSLAAVVAVTLNSPPVKIHNLMLGTNGDFSLQFAGISNATYRVWGSTNLTSWVVLGYAAQSPPGVFGFTDTNLTNWPQRFYRVTAP